MNKMQQNEKINHIGTFTAAAGRSLFRLCHNQKKPKRAERPYASE